MSDLEKAKIILRILNTQKLEFKGAREAFSFTESYTWLIELAKKIEKQEMEKDKNGIN